MLDFLVSFNVVGEEVDPDEVSRIIGLTSNRSHRRGDPHYGKSGRRYADHYVGLWSLESPLSRECPLEEHLNHFASLIQGKAEGIEFLRSRGLHVEFFIGVFQISDGDEISLSASVLSALSILGVDVRFDLYRADDPDEADLYVEV